MAVARDLKLTVPPELIAQLQLRVSTPELGFEPANELLQRGADFTAIVCYNDISAIGAVRRMSRSWAAGSQRCFDRRLRRCSGRGIS